MNAIFIDIEYFSVSVKFSCTDKANFYSYLYCLLAPYVVYPISVMLFIFLCPLVHCRVKQMYLGWLKLSRSV